MAPAAPSAVPPLQSLSVNAAPPAAGVPSDAIVNSAGQLNDALRVVCSPATLVAERDAALEKAQELLKDVLAECQVVHTAVLRGTKRGTSGEPLHQLVQAGIAPAVPAAAVPAVQDLGLRGFLSATTTLAYYLGGDQPRLERGGFNSGFTLTAEQYPLFGTDCFVRSSLSPDHCDNATSELFHVLYASYIGLGPVVHAAWVVDAQEPPFKPLRASVSIANKMVVDTDRDATREALREMVGGPASAERTAAIVDKLRKRIREASTQWCLAEEDVASLGPGRCSLTVIMESYSSNGTHGLFFGDQRSFGRCLGQLAVKIGASGFWLADLKLQNIVLRLADLNDGPVLDARAIDLDPKLTLLAFPKDAPRESELSVSTAFHAVLLLLSYLYACYDPRIGLRGRVAIGLQRDQFGQFYGGLMAGLGYDDPDFGAKELMTAFLVGPTRISLARYLKDYTRSDPDAVDEWDFFPQAWYFLNFQDDYNSYHNGKDVDGLENTLRLKEVLTSDGKVTDLFKFGARVLRACDDVLPRAPARP